MKRTKLLAFGLSLSLTLGVVPSLAANAATINSSTSTVSNTQSKSTFKLIKQGTREPFKPSKDLKNHAEGSFIEKSNTQTDPLAAMKTTKTGAGGSATIDTYEKSVWWKVRPATSWPYEFAGVIQVEYYDGNYEDFEVNGSGLLGTSCSGAVPLSYSGGYKVTFSGVATALNGTAYVTVPGLDAGFGY
jgi:hypothetical protein